MQIKYLFIQISCLFLLLLSQNAFAQKVTKNTNGDQIIVYPDGSWRYFDAQSANDIALLKAQLGETAVEESETPETSEEKSKQKYIQISSAEERKARVQALRYADSMAAKEQRAHEAEEVAISERKKVQQALKELRKDPEASLLDIEDLEDELLLMKEAEKEAKAHRKAMVKESKQAEKMVDMSKAERDKKLAKMAKKKRKKDANQAAQAATALANEEGLDETIQEEYEEAVTEATTSVSTTNESSAALYQFSDKDNVLLNPPTPDCALSFNGIDEFTKRKRRDVAKKRLFSFTSDKARPYLKGKEHIVCEGFVSAISGGYRILSLIFSINSENAAKEFASIPQGSVLTLMFLDGKSIRLSNKVADRGRLDPLTKTTYYKAQYLIGSSEEKVLRKKELDRLRIVWEKGYDDYEIYEMDFFINQFICLEQTK